MDDPLDHLQQRHLEKDLALGHAQHLAGLILAFGDGLDAAAVDLGEIAGVVDDEGQQRRPEPRQQRQVKQKARPVKDDEDLDHQGGAPHHPHHRADQPAQGGDPAHGPQGDDKAQRQREQKGQGKQFQGGAQPFQQSQGDGQQHRRFLSHSTSPAPWRGRTCLLVFGSLLFDDGFLDAVGGGGLHHGAVVIGFFPEGVERVH